MYQRRMLRTPFLVWLTPSCPAISSWVSRSYEALVLSGYWKEDLLEARLLPDGAVAGLRSAGLEAESQPPVRGVDQGALRAGRCGILRFEGGGEVPLLRDARDDGQPVVDRVAEGPDDIELLLLGEERALAGVAEHDEALDAVDRAEPRAQALNGVVVDVAIGGERGNGGGVQAAEVEDHRRLLHRLFVERS
ncbi:hypothetical protein QE412_003157 [Microbacterium trichothecenolyticum]|uniref:Uncharacterized protein n=1 Tax=Microbacterium trichothecenolyticum TaxID=69370 RepID=A0ABU0TY43_MICTR|nr:hypothetical protein [Microbacterium trichothecenolyticum]